MMDGDKAMSAALKKELFSDDVVMEAFSDMRSVQPMKDRSHYFDIVLEGSSEANAILLQKLYNDVISKSNIDFGSIPDSRGNLLKYKEYPLMEQSIDRINRLYQGIPNDDVKLMNELHDMIISCKKDYEFGFLNDIEMLKIMYNVSVMSLHEMISLCVFEYTKKMRNDAGINFSFAKTKKQNLIIVKNTKSLIKAYRNGQFAKVAKEFKKNPRLLDNGSATEAGVTPILTAVKGAVTAIAAHPAIAIPLAIIGAFILLLTIIRGAIYLFYSGSVSVRDYVQTEKQIVDIYIESEKNDGASEKVINKHNKISQKLQSIANFIEVKILNNDKQAKQELEKSNREDFNSSDFTFSDIEL